MNEAQQLGRRLFEQSCGVCHTKPTLTSPLFGPQLSKQSLGGNADALRQIIGNGTPRMPGFKYHFQPAQIDAIVARAMARERERRYAQWGEFSIELAQLFRAGRRVARKAQEFADSDRFETLRELAFFQEFSDAELWEVAHISTWRHADAGEQLMKEGDAGAEFCILAEGEVKVTKRGKLLNVLHVGEPFGEMAYLSSKDKRRGADVTVTGEASIVSIATAKLAQVSEGCRHRFDRAFMAILVERLSAANVRLSGV
jgi:hypothetical protein